ncbi:MAG: 3-hydroxyacyl-CoA dehydrogenase family protein [Planctomycetes bacterium]|nr:3-hydroxyacyl-CoA dehydrogenase family protein [Planctomycetota bacterium]
MECSVVLGAGTMGNGIAQVCAQAGMHVQLFDVAEDQLEIGLAAIQKMLAKAVAKGKTTFEEASAVESRINGTTDLSGACAGADLVIEAIPEVLKLKQSVLRDVESSAPSDALLGTNTSSLSISKIAESLERPDRFLGLHFFNPVPLMALLEIVVGPQTSEKTLDVARQLGARLLKEGIVVKDTPGFASSRLGVALGLEAIRMLESGVASAADIDKAMELGYRHPMGPLRLTDLVGLDVRLGIAEYLAQELGPRFEPPQLMRDMVEQGELGKKAGQGFYTWE